MTYQTKTIDGKKYKLIPVDDTPYRLTETFDFEVYPHDIPETMTYVNAVKAVESIGDGWRIPTRMELQLMYQHKDKIGGFKTQSASGSYPDWYWSSTEDRDNPSYVWGVRFSDGLEDWFHKYSSRLSCLPVRLSCLPVRLVAVPG